MLKACNILLVFALTGLVACRENAPIPTNPQSRSAVGSTDESVVVRKLVAAVGRDQESVRFDYRGTCDSDDTEIIALPAIELGSTAGGHNAITRVQGLLGGNQQMSITEQPIGIVHVRFGDLTSEILQTKIGRLSLNNDERHDPREAINAIYRSPELKASLSRLNARHVYEMGHLIGHPVLHAAQVGPTNEDITVDQFLDDILRAFPGAVVYKECKRRDKRLFDITYYDR